MPLQLEKTENSLDLQELIQLILKEEVSEKNDFSFAINTSNNFHPIYEAIVSSFQSGDLSFNKTTFYSTEEFENVSWSNTNTAYQYLDKYFYSPLEIKDEQKIIPFLFNMAHNNEYDGRIANNKIDLAILELGPNGELGFLNSFEKLTDKSSIQNIKNYQMENIKSWITNPENQVPNSIFSIGMGGIFTSKKLVVYASGVDKLNVVKRILFSDRFDPNVPASVLQKHRNATLILDPQLSYLLGN
ncbi:hypothetical protein [Mycoplasma sp. Mirounga ES2805-ORL]|uniref:hypothetical protein n=1 Tax=Mycoplasma sp. Mirounga ES2805-ORL TaxID=754514 RepID=UPI00197C4AE1|nr:hypothetical protein [Mycoplasma sp. Mirounga ES2805-ORL]QSF13760.1 hypothetical protein JXZ90_00455 [Mycoplasma sp. Mirounga ES2805-ORL]